MSRADLQSCLERIPNQFELCHVAAKRARQLARGAPSQVPAGEHKSTVQSLIEVSEGLVDKSVLDEADLPMIEVPSPHLGPLEDY